MVEQEEAERLEELERFLDTASDSELDSDNASQSGGDDARSDAEALDEENENSSDENNGDSTESEPDAPRLRKRPGRKPKPIKKKKRRKPKDRPQIVGLRVEQFYADGTANMVVKMHLVSIVISLEDPVKLTPYVLYRACWSTNVQAHSGDRRYDGSYSQRS